MTAQSHLPIWIEQSKRLRELVAWLDKEYPDTAVAHPADEALERIEFLESEIARYREALGQIAGTKTGPMNEIARQALNG